ncbi:dihydroorotate dehydrogenase B catalytic subunit [Pigmentiphaga sp. NML080357]|uniref:dihydroorotate dehydrogenase n=1 Tax=Pigmentiphaga sp. NML080357 TaxID=2008675 RepID=UPI000B41D8B4|nr:dihydroorotate dehydrogenase [Pigmentiphaga sp. NML080357]OVZ64772.1 dihydroorotate dehydrogenase B catalytic subunit [Pigmentiphaga sp. NML080357]
MIDLSVDVGGLRLSNPVMPASGTFADGLANTIDFNRLGAFVTKTITHEKRTGNPVPRVAEVHSGMLNAIGIPSKGSDYFIRESIPFYRKFSPPLVVSISAPSNDGFARLAAELSRVEGVAAIEANISCPNIEEDGKAFAMHARSTAAVVKALRASTSLPLWVKLTPNTGEIANVARAAQEEGADAIVVANTILGMAIDIDTRRPKLGNVMGGMSGPAIKPIVVRMVYQCHRAVSIPIIGCGGISTADDAIEYMLAGAAAVQVGTATFVHPTAMIEVIDGLVQYCRRKGMPNLQGLVGAVEDTGFVPFEAMA